MELIYNFSDYSSLLRQKNNSLFKQDGNDSVNIKRDFY